MIGVYKEHLFIMGKKKYKVKDEYECIANVEPNLTPFLDPPDKPQNALWRRFRGSAFLLFLGLAVIFNPIAVLWTWFLKANPTVTFSQFGISQVFGVFVFFVFSIFQVARSKYIGGYSKFRGILNSIVTTMGNVYGGFIKECGDMDRCKMERVKNICQGLVGWLYSIKNNFRTGVDLDVRKMPVDTDYMTRLAFYGRQRVKNGYYMSEEHVVTTDPNEEGKTKAQVTRTDQYLEAYYGLIQKDLSALINIHKTHPPQYHTIFNKTIDSVNTDIGKIGDAGAISPLPGFEEILVITMIIYFVFAYPIFYQEYTLTFAYFFYNAVIYAIGGTLIYAMMTTNPFDDPENNPFLGSGLTVGKEANNAAMTVYIHAEETFNRFGYTLYVKKGILKKKMMQV